MQINKNILNELLYDYDSFLKIGRIKLVYDDIFTNDKGSVFIQSLINLGYTPEQIIDKMREQSKSRLNNGLFKNIDFPEKHRSVSLASIEYILAKAFYFSNVARVTDTQNIRIVGEYAFAGSTLESITLPAITNIDSNAFRSCKNLTTIILGENLYNVGNEVFYNCHNLKTIVFEGSANQWEAIPGIYNIFEPGYLPIIIFKK